MADGHSFLPISHNNPDMNRMEPNSENQSINTYPPMLKSIWFWGGIIGLVLILGGAWISFSQLQQLNNASGGGAVSLGVAPVAGHLAPDFELKALNGETLRLSDFRGKTVLVNFWATWCGPCRAEFPEFQEASLEHADDLVIIGVNNTSVDQADNVPGFVDELGITFPIVYDETGDVVKAYRVLGLPTSVFIDTDGVVIEVFTGPINKAYIQSKL